MYDETKPVHAGDLPSILEGSKNYTDEQIAGLSTEATDYIDSQISAVRGEIPTSLPANGGIADMLKAITISPKEGTNWIKIAGGHIHINACSIILQVFDGAVLNSKNDQFGILAITIGASSGSLLTAKIHWTSASSDINFDNYVLGYYKDDSNNYHFAVFVNVTNTRAFSIVPLYVDSPSVFNVIKNDEGTADIPTEYSTIVKSTLYNNMYIDTELADLKAFIGYTDSDVYGLEADFENNRFTRLAGAVGKNPGADFDSVNAFGGRRRCAVSNNGSVASYNGDSNYEEDGMFANGTIAQIMVEQPKFYYKVVPLKTEKINGAEGYHLRKARYYISDIPKPGFKVHPAFVQNGVELDKIYLSAYEGCIRDMHSATNHYVLNDAQQASFNVDQLSSIALAKPASGTTQELTRANALKLAQNRGAGWGITTIQTLSATQLLFSIEYATFNSQAAIGNGVVDTTETIKTGSTSSLGNASGSVESGGVSYRGEENLWGNLYKFIDGVHFDNIGDNSTMYISEKPISIVKDSNKFPSAFRYTSEWDWLFWPSEFNGNSSFLTGDIIVNGATGTSLGLMVGGRYSSAALSAGMFCDSVYSAAHSADRGARLIYIPQEVIG